MSTSWKSIVGGVAPALAGVLGGPAAGVAVKVLADTLLGGSSGSQAEDEARISSVLAGGLTPEVRIKLIEAEAEVKRQAHELRMAVLGQQTELIKLDTEDRHSARRANVDGGNQRRVFWFAVLIFVGVLSVNAAVLLLGMPPGVDPAVSGRILGTLDAAVLVALYYIFGSSSGSAMKTERFGA